jgi:hypothetical protein
MTDDLITTEDDPVAFVPARRTLIAGVAVGVVVLVGAFTALLSPRSAPTTTTPRSDVSVFIGDVGAAVGAAWWEAVRSGDNGLVDLWTHPDSPLSAGEVSSFAPDPEADITVDQVPFGSLDQPQLCYLIELGEFRDAGSMVFRSSGTQWLIWEIRPGVESCSVLPNPNS